MNRQDFALWWAEYSQQFQYSNVSEETIAAARSASEAAWYARGEDCYS